MLFERHLRPADAPAALADVRATNPAYMLDEIALTAWARRLQSAQQVGDAIGVFRLSALLHPTSASSHASLGDAYAANGDRALAIESYQRSLDLNASNVRVADALKKLKGP
jgi:Flp pilus assembly protein TadD